MKKKQIQNMVMVIIAGLFLGGCAIKPRPVTMAETRARAEEDLVAAFAGQEPVDGPISLSEAMARAILYNLDHRAALMEKALAHRRITVSRYELLPSLAASAGYKLRSEYYGASSQALTGSSAGQQSLVMSTSQEKASATADVTMVWNVLDFGVSYAKARQQADHYLIVEEQRRKALQSIMQEVRSAYWRALGVQDLIGEMKGILKRTESALARTEQIAQKRYHPLRVSLEYQQALLENIRQIKGIIHGMSMARNELATLMNLRPGTPFTLLPVDWNRLDIPGVPMPLDRLEETALALRPELRQEDYKLRISVMETRKAILEMLPGINLNFGLNYDGNDFLYTDTWASAGTAVSMNIFNLFSGPAKYKAGKSDQELSIIRRRAMTMAVLAQVHLSVRQYEERLDEFRVNQQLSRVTTQIQHLVSVNEMAGKGGELEVVLSATRALGARMRHHLAYAELQSALGRIYASAGIDLVPEQVQGKGVRELARALETGLARHKDEQWPQK